MTSPTPSRSVAVQQLHLETDSLDRIELVLDGGTARWPGQRPTAADICDDAAIDVDAALCAGGIHRCVGRLAAAAGP